MGGLWQLLAREAGEILFGIAFLAFVVLLAISHVAEARVSKDYGVTMLIAAMITFVLGALAVRGHHVIAATGAVLTTILLSLKPLLHSWLQRIEAAELAAALKLLLVSVVILPVLPDQGYGPWQSLNPYEIWWLVVLMATISFAAYCAVKVAGAEKGILLTGFLGGLVSSTAATIHLARLARTLEQRRILAAGVLVASATMFMRVLLVATIVNSGLFQPLSLPLVLMTLTIFGFAVLYWVWKRERAVIAPLTLHNPVKLLRATQFGVLLAFVLPLTKAIQAWLGHTGIYLLAGISGVADVDAITISLARLAGNRPVNPGFFRRRGTSDHGKYDYKDHFGYDHRWPDNGNPGSVALNDRFGGWRHGVVASSILIVIVHRNSRTASRDADFAPL